MITALYLLVTVSSTVLVERVLTEFTFLIKKKRILRLSSQFNPKGKLHQRFYNIVMFASALFASPTVFLSLPTLAPTFTPLIMCAASLYKPTAAEEVNIMLTEFIRISAHPDALDCNRRMYGHKYSVQDLGLIYTVIQADSQYPTTNSPDWSPYISVKK